MTRGTSGEAVPFLGRNNLYFVREIRGYIYMSKSPDFAIANANVNVNAFAIVIVNAIA
jgi:hypothetical protein